jgi:hypothetical protein
MELNLNLPFNIEPQNIYYYSVLGKNMSSLSPKSPCSNFITNARDGNTGISHSNANARDGLLKVKFDVRTTAVAVALNLGIISTDILLRIDSRALAYNKVIAYIDPWYSPPMEPVYCLDKVAWKLTQRQIDGPEICFIMKVINQPRCCCPEKRKFIKPLTPTHALTHTHFRTCFTGFYL